jgi:hypothetical protein
MARTKLASLMDIRLARIAVVHYRERRILRITAD